MDAVDFNGEQQINVDHDIVKIGRSTDKDMNLMISQKELGSDAFEILIPPGYCGSCFGVENFNEDGSKKCCNTCNDVRDAFLRVGRSESLALASPQVFFLFFILLLLLFFFFLLFALFLFFLSLNLLYSCFFLFFYLLFLSF